jgi:hypothetical protein
MGPEASSGETHGQAHLLDDHLSLDGYAEAAEDVLRSTKTAWRTAAISMVIEGRFAFNPGGQGP